jgi:DNA-damage-inducible protein J
MAQVNIRIDDSLKERADVLFDELGISMTTAFNIFVRQSLRQGGIPFDVTVNTDPFYSVSNMRVLRQSIADMDAGINCSVHELIEVDDE